MNEHLERMSQLNDFDIAPGEPDIRGWTVKTAQGREIGSVSDLIIAPEAMKVRQIEVNLNRDVRPGSGEHQVMAPIASADIDTRDKSVILHGLTAEQIGTLPAYGRDADARAAADLPTEYARSSDAAAARTLTRAEEQLHIGKRTVQTGEARIGKHIETEHVRKEVPVTREQVHVERRPVTGADRSAVIGRSEDEIRVPLMGEEVVVEKRPVVEEELVITKERVEGKEIVDTDIRKERFDVDQPREPGLSRDTTRKGRA
jgi:uncharacterized protein (TIGR02271 family)